MCLAHKTLPNTQPSSLPEMVHITTLSTNQIITYSFSCHDQIQPFVESARKANDTLLSRHSLLTNDAKSGIHRNSFGFSKWNLVRLLLEKKFSMRTHRHLS